MNDEDNPKRKRGSEEPPDMQHDKHTGDPEENNEQQERGTVEGDAAPENDKSEHKSEVEPCTPAETECNTANYDTQQEGTVESSDYTKEDNNGVAKTE